VRKGSETSDLLFVPFSLHRKVQLFSTCTSKTTRPFPCSSSGSAKAHTFIWICLFDLFLPSSIRIFSSSHTSTTTTRFVGCNKAMVRGVLGDDKTKLVTRTRYEFHGSPFPTITLAYATSILVRITSYIKQRDLYFPTVKIETTLDCYSRLNNGYFSAPNVEEPIIFTSSSISTNFH